MSKMLIVAHQEVGYYLRQWSFYVTILLIPLVFAAVGVLPQLRQVAQKAPLPRVETVFDLASEELKQPVGYVDEAGIIKAVSIAGGHNLHRFDDEATATQALEQGRIESFYLIAADYVQSGQVMQFSLNPQLLTDTDGAIRALLRQNLVRSMADANLAARLEKPIKLLRHGPPPQAVRFIPNGLDMGRLVSAGLVIGLFVYLINVGGNLLLRALQREVRARVLEVMIVSTTPTQFIGGKLLGLTSLTVVQGGLALAAGALVYGRNPDSSGPAALPLTILALGIPYLALGFLAYCGGIMGVAAMWPNFRESGILLASIRLLSLTPLIGGLFILPNSDGPIAVGLTLAPITSHLLMPFRLLLTDVPAWQWSLGLVSLGIWTLFWLWLSTRLFRVYGLLTGRAVSARMVWQAIWDRRG